MMTILAVDDESAALSILDRAILETLPDAKLQSFSLASEALCEVEVHGARPDVAFLDIKMPGVGGLEMAKRIKEASPRTNIVFCDGLYRLCAGCTGSSSQRLSDEAGYGGKSEDRA